RTCALRLRLRSREEFAERRLVVEAQGNQNSLGHAEPIFRRECRARVTMQAASIAAIGACAGFAKAALLILNDDVGRQEADQVGAVLDQPAGPLMQSQRI